MKKYISLLLLAACFSIYLLAVSESAHAKSQLTRVKGTNISLIPPSGFSETAKFSGFWKTGHYAFINVREVDLPFAKTIAELASFGAPNEKVTVGTCESVQEGKLCHGTLAVSGYFSTKLSYVFPASKNRTVIVEGVVWDREYKQTLDQVQDAILTAVYTSSNIDPLEGSEYIVERRAPFQFTHKIESGFAFTKEAGFYAENTKADFYLLRSFGALGESLAVQAKKELMAMGYTNVQIQSEQVVRINEMKAYEMIARAETKKTHQSRLIYQTLIPTRTSYYLLRGILNSENEKYLPVVKEIAATFRKKG